MFNALFYTLKAIILFPIMIMVIIVTTIFDKKKPATVITKTNEYKITTTSSWVSWVLYPLFYVDPMLLKPVYVAGDKKSIYVCEIFKDYFDIDAYVLFMWWYIRLIVEKDNVTNVSQEYRTDLMPYIDSKTICLIQDQIRQWLSTFGEEAFSLTRSSGNKARSYYLDSILTTMLMLEKELS